jgi:hypothetical protein
MARALDRIRQRPSQGRAIALQELDGGSESLLLVAAERIPPLLELVRELDVLQGHYDP